MNLNKIQKSTTFTWGKPFCGRGIYIVYLSALKGRNIPTQGEALCFEGYAASALKGSNKNTLKKYRLKSRFKHFLCYISDDANQEYILPFQGFTSLAFPIRRAAPFADIFRPFRAIEQGIYDLEKFKLKFMAAYAK